MTLLEWKKRNNLTYPRIVKLLGGQGIRRSRVSVVNVWIGKSRPKLDFFLAIKKLTGLEDEEILGGKDD